MSIPAKPIECKALRDSVYTLWLNIIIIIGLLVTPQGEASNERKAMYGTLILIRGESSTAHA